MNNEEFIERINKAAEIINKASLEYKPYIILPPSLAYKLEEMMKKEQLIRERKEKLKKLNELK